MIKTGFLVFGVNYGFFIDYKLRLTIRNRTLKRPIILYLFVFLFG